MLPELGTAGARSVREGCRPREASPRTAARSNHSTSVRHGVRTASGVVQEGVGQPRIASPGGTILSGSQDREAYTRSQASPSVKPARAFDAWPTRRGPAGEGFMTEQWTPSDEPTPSPAPVSYITRTRLHGGEILRIGIVIGCLVVLVASAAVTIGASPSPATRPVDGTGRIGRAGRRQGPRRPLRLPGLTGPVVRSRRQGRPFDRRRPDHRRADRTPRRHDHDHEDRRLQREPQDRSTAGRARSPSRTRPRSGSAARPASSPTSRSVTRSAWPRRRTPTAPSRSR